MKCYQRISHVCIVLALCVVGSALTPAVYAEFNFTVTADPRSNDAAYNQVLAAMNANIGGQGVSLWDEEDGFFYDVLRGEDGELTPLKVRSFVGLIPLFAVETIREEQLEALPRFRQSMEWFMQHRPELTENIVSFNEKSAANHLQLAVVNRGQLERILDRLFDKKEFLSDYGLRSLSKHHLKKPFTCSVNGSQQTVGYEPGESPSGLFGGNSNWRGPIWFPINYLMIQSLRKFYYHYYKHHYS